MDRTELQEAIDLTKEQIYKLKQLIEETSDLRERRRLQCQLKELQILQLWHLDQLGEKR